jgi:hypothetical protein
MEALLVLIAIATAFFLGQYIAAISIGVGLKREGYSLQGKTIIPPNPPNVGSGGRRSHTTAEK